MSGSAARMKVGVLLFGIPYDRIAVMARRAEQLGVDSLWVPEHLVLPVRFRSRYPYSADGTPPVPPDMPFLDPLITLTQIAAATSTVRIGTNIYLLALRHPLETARRVMTLDLLSGGRVILGVGTGWLAEEFEASGVDFATRGARSSECIEALHTLWTAEEPEFHGRFFSFGPVRFEPKPLQKPHPPIIVAGDAPSALRRAVRLADGWCGLGHTPDSAAPQVAALRTLLAASDRARDSFEIMVSFGNTALTRDDVQRYAAAGVDHIIVLPWDRAEDAEAQLEQLAARLQLQPVR